MLPQAIESSGSQNCCSIARVWKIGRKKFTNINRVNGKLANPSKFRCLMPRSPVGTMPTKLTHLLCPNSLPCFGDRARIQPI
uniref:Uncharacterized protein sll1747.1 n=1 Tax=Synechocystis sp. (strain ATCC 27184 / PCC 6803 / Kazusa) TaxID=1111708 RepID=YE7X_SYNY3|nr:RecName: Full=Uncharacterized protein sll1747.1 [Synechocystis sp. PCC 6803 substr. Kazusa]CAA47856.1 unnamed protein product [Synechocystis sp. PCC 6803]